MFKKSPLNSTRLKKHKRRLLILKIVGCCIVLVILVLAISWLTKIHALTLTDVAVEGNGAVDSQSITAVVKNDMSGSYYYLFSRSNRLLYPKDHIKADLLKTFPRLATVDLRVRNNHTVVVSVTERSPAYTWCSGSPEDHINPECFFMDSYGYVFSTAPEFSSNVFFAFYGLINADTAIGSHYLDNSTLTSIYNLSSFLGKNAIHSYALLAQSSGEYDLYFGNNSRILFKNDQSINDIMTNLGAIMKDTTVLSKGASNLDYIDLRLGDKIYYKYFGDNS